MASRGVLGAMAGLGQGLQQAGQTMSDTLKFQYLQKLRQQDKQEERAYQEQQTAEDRQFRKSLVEDERARQDAQRGVRQEIEGDKLVTYNEAGDVVESKPYVPKQTRQYLDPKVESEIEGIDAQLKALRSKEYQEDEDRSMISDLERRRQALLSGGDARPARDISSGIVDDMLFDGSGRGILRGAAASPRQPATTMVRTGDVVDGYRFKGGNPNDPDNWEAVR